MKLQNKKITIFLFGVYFAALIWIILFKMDLSILSFRQPRSMNPFSASAISNGTIDLSELLNNILIFIPCGIYACMLLPERSFFIKVLPAFFISLGLELFQFLLAVGACDITDLINNTFGGIIGIILYWIFSKIFKKHTSWHSLPQHSCLPLLPYFLLEMHKESAFCLDRAATNREIN